MIILSAIALFCIGAVVGFVVGLLMATLLVVAAEKEEQ